MTDINLETQLKIEQIEKEIRETPYHKGTEHHIGKLRARLARLKDEQLVKVGGGGRGGGFAWKKTGDASIALVGPPSVGKSTLLNAITNAESKVGAYDFTTLGVIPGMMDYNEAKIQIFDIPGIVDGAALGKGKGKQVLSVARSVDLVVIMVDTKTVNKIADIAKELEMAGFRLNRKPPKVVLKKMPSGGVITKSVTGLTFTGETVKSLAEEFRFTNGEVVIGENVSTDQLIDVFIGNRIYVPAFCIINKFDIKTKAYIPCEYGEVIKISAKNGFGLEDFKAMVWTKLGLMRLYLGKEDKKPLIIKFGKTLREILETISIDRDGEIRYAKLYGPNAKFNGQETSLDHIPSDGSRVEFI